MKPDSPYPTTITMASTYHDDTGSLNTFPPLLFTPSIQSNPRKSTKFVPNISSIRMSKTTENYLSIIIINLGPKMTCSLHVNATVITITKEHIQLS